MSDKWIECYYGESGTGKSESAAAVIRRIYKETGKKARVLVGDGSSATYSALESAGVVEMADYTIRDWPLSSMKLFLEGQWPADAADPKSPFRPISADVMKQIGVYVIEGLTVASGYIMGDKRGGFAERAGKGEKIGQDSPIMLIDQERNAAGQLIKDSGPGTVFGGNPLSHYQVAQKRMLGFVETSKGLPGWVIWTAHQRAAEDKTTGQKLIGPEVAGSALTAGISKYFNNTLHFSTAEKTAKEQDAHIGKTVDVVDAEYRIYTKDHFRPEGGVYVKYKAVTRHPDPTGELFGAKPLPLYFENKNPGVSILEFYENIALARQGQIASLKSSA